MCVRVCACGWVCGGGDVHVCPCMCMSVCGWVGVCACGWVCSEEVIVGNVAVLVFNLGNINQ